MSTISKVYGVLWYEYENENVNYTKKNIVTAGGEHENDDKRYGVKEVPKTTPNKNVVVWGCQLSIMIPRLYLSLEI